MDQVFKSTSYHPTIQGNKCQGYGHIAVNCPTPVKVTKVKKPPVTNPEPLPPLLPTPSVVICSDRQHLSPLLPTSSPVRVVIDKLYVTNTESDSEEFTYQVEEPKDSNSDKEDMGGNIEEFSTSSPLEVIPVTTVYSCLS